MNTSIRGTGKWVGTLVLSLCVFLGEAVAEPEPLKLGALFSLTGVASVAGQGELNGTQLAVEEINRAGGVGGRRIELVVEDNQSDFAKTATAFRKLANVDKVPVVFGPNWAEYAEIVAPLAEQENVVMLTATGYTKELTKNRPFVFTGMPAHNFLLEPFSQNIIDQKHEKIALLVSQNSYTEAIADILLDYFRTNNEPIGDVQYFQTPSFDFRTSISKLKSEGFDAVILFLTEGTGGTASFLKQSRELGFGGALYSGPAIQFDHVVQEDLSLAEGVVFFDYLVSEAPEFERKYEARFQTKRILGTTKAYDLVYTVKAAIERCGTESQEIRRCLSRGVYPGVSGPIAFELDGNFKGNTYVVRILRVEQGKYRELKALS